MPAPVDHRTSVALDLGRLRRAVDALPPTERAELAPAAAELAYTTARAAMVEDGPFRLDEWAGWIIARLRRIFEDLPPAQRERLAPSLVAIAEGRRSRGR